MSSWKNETKCSPSFLLVHFLGIFVEAITWKEQVPGDEPGRPACPGLRGRWSTHDSRPGQALKICWMLIAEHLSLHKLLRLILPTRFVRLSLVLLSRRLIEKFL